MYSIAIQYPMLYLARLIAQLFSVVDGLQKGKEVIRGGKKINYFVFFEKPHYINPEAFRAFFKEKIKKHEYSK